MYFLVNLCNFFVPLYMQLVKITYHDYNDHISFMELGHLLTCFGLTYP